MLEVIVELMGLWEIFNWTVIEDRIVRYDHAVCYLFQDGIVLVVYYKTSDNYTKEEQMFIPYPTDFEEMKSLLPQLEQYLVSKNVLVD